MSNKTDPIELICNATGNPISLLKWTYNGQILASSANESNSMAIDDKRLVKQIQTKFVIENQRSISMQIKLIIKHCSIGANSFNCIAFNDFSKDERSVIVTGNLKPIFLISPNETHKSANESSSITIDCNVNGYPEPTIIWLKVRFFPIFSTNYF